MMTAQGLGCTTCCHDDSTVGRQSAVAALDVHELLHADVRAEPGLVQHHQHFSGIKPISWQGQPAVPLHIQQQWHSTA